MARFGRSMPASPLIGPQRFGAGSYEIRSFNKYQQLFAAFLSGEVIPTGAMVELIAKAFAGAETPSGALTDKVTKTLAGSETPAGANAFKVIKLFSGGVTPSGALRSAINKFFSGGVGPTGAMAKLIVKSFSGGETPVGNLIVFMPLYNTAIAARVRSGLVALHSFMALTATAARLRAGRGFPSAYAPSVAGTSVAIRWRFDDLVTGDGYLFEVNPNVGGSASARKTITAVPTSAADGSPLRFEGDDEMLTGEFSGVINSQGQYDALKTWWALRRPVQLTDDLLRRSTVVITKVSPKRGWTKQHHFRQQVTVTYKILQRTEV